MKEKIDILLNEYLNDESTLVDSTKNYYIEFVRKLPEHMYRYFKNNIYLIKASIGVGQKSEIPWICIFNRNVTTTATKGIYLCYLFKKDMTGFYLVLGQGITTFDELYGSERYKNIKKVANYFRNLIDDEKFSRDPIDLGGNKSLSEGYEEGTIISKYYDKNNFTENELLKDLSDLKIIYDEICENLINESYMNVVNNVVNNMDPSFIIAEEANKMIEKALLDESGTDDAEITTLSLIDIPEPLKSNKFSSMSRKTVKKIDYDKKARTNARNGLLGEELVLSYEEDRLKKMGREDLAQKIKWVSKEDDGTGYDIISYDVEESGKVIEKYIEVKSTEGKEKNIFFVSANELDVFNKLGERYFIYRVCNVKSKHPELFILNYQDFNARIQLDVDNYKASLKTD